MYFKPYSIDDIVTSDILYRTNISYIISKSEGYSPAQENISTEYKGANVRQHSYSASAYNAKSKPVKSYYFLPQIFLNPIRPNVQFINTLEQIQHHIEETFELMLKRKLPQDILIRVCSDEELKELHSAFGPWSEGIRGFALNEKGQKKIFVKSNNLDVLMLTIGHEIGHVYTDFLGNRHDEEAKAFSFAAEWAKAIKENNIGNLAESIKSKFEFNPARNGLHDISFL